MVRVWAPQVLVVGLLLWALNPENPYAYYTLLRWVCCAVFGYLAVRAAQTDDADWAWVLGVTAALYNPVVPVHLTRALWSAVNVATIGIAALSVFRMKLNRR